MKRGMFLLALLLVLPTVFAGSVGISPAYYVNHFEPGFERDYSFRVFNPSTEYGISVELSGGLAQYANLSDDFVYGGDSFGVSLSLPESLDKPGIHILYVVVRESQNGTDPSSIGGIASIKAPIKILVPYPGEYVESSLRVSNINEGEKADYELEVQNLGTDDVEFDVNLEVFRVDEDGQSVLNETINGLFLETKNTKTISDNLETGLFDAGEYYVQATIVYGNKTDVVSDYFKVGEFMVEIVDYDYIFERNKINEFNIIVENKWNTEINSIYADVAITDEGKVISTFRTISVDTNPWEVKNLTGFFDAGRIDVGRYLANINVKYGDSSTHKLVAIYVENPPRERNYFIYALIVIAVLSLGMIIGFSILIYRLNKLNNKVKRNEKRK